MTSSNASKDAQNIFGKFKKKFGGGGGAGGCRGVRGVVEVCPTTAVVRGTCWTSTFGAFAVCQGRTGRYAL